MLLNRLTERAALAQLLEAARGGRSGALVVHGEAGVGKTALLEDAIASAAGMRIARVAGIESEIELAYAALQQLCAPMRGGLDRLPNPQRQALGVVARRLLGEPVALVVAAREPGGEFRGLPELVVGGLDEADARDLLGTVISQPLDEQVRERFIAETGGNPLALLELPRGLTQADLDGGFDVMAAPGLLGRLEDSFRRRLEALPRAARRLLLVAAAE